MLTLKGEKIFKPENSKMQKRVFKWLSKDIGDIDIPKVTIIFENLLVAVYFGTLRGANGVKPETLCLMWDDVYARGLYLQYHREGREVHVEYDEDACAKFLGPYIDRLLKDELQGTGEQLLLRLWNIGALNTMRNIIADDILHDMPDAGTVH